MFCFFSVRECNFLTSGERLCINLVLLQCNVNFTGIHFTQSYMVHASGPRGTADWKWVIYISK